MRNSPNFLDMMVMRLRLMPIACLLSLSFVTACSHISSQSASSGGGMNAAAVCGEVVACGGAYGSAFSLLSVRVFGGGV